MYIFYKVKKSLYLSVLFAFSTILGKEIPGFTTKNIFNEKDNFKK